MLKNRKNTNDSLGVECFDALIGVGTGGTILHSLILLDENWTNGRYVNSIQRCFIAEGCDQKDDIFIAGPNQEKLINILQKLPKKNQKNMNNKDENVASTSSSEEDFKIAWRYKTTSPLQSSTATIGKNYYANENSKFNLSLVDSEFDFQKAKDDCIFIFNFNGEQPSFSSLWNAIFEKIMDPKYALKQKNAKTIRIVLNDFSSPIWSDIDYLPLFFAHLKSHSRHSNMIVLISLDSILLRKSFFDNCIQYVDAHFQLQKMEEDEQIKLHLRHRIDGGRFFVHKLPTIISTAPIQLPHSIDLLFSLRKSFFELKLLHLPPAIGEEQEKTASKMACQAFVDQF